MLRRSLTCVSLLLLVAVPLSAQKKKEKKDHDKKVAGGALPAGWSARTDSPQQKISDAKFVTMGTGFHVTSGPAAIYWNGESMVKGAFSATATFKQTKNPEHPEAYGMFFGGKKLDGADQTYYYLLVRGDGKFLLNHRAGAAVHKVMPWTENAAVKRADASGVATNTIRIDATKSDSVRMFVNGVPVAALAGSYSESTDGVVGLRVNHNLDVHISDFTITRSK